MRQRGPGPAPAPAPADPVRAASVRAIAEQLSTLRGPLLPVLHEVVATHGYVTDDDVMVVAEVLNLSRADVHGVVTFYPTCAALPRPRTGSRCAAARPARRAAPRGCTPRPPTAGPARPPSRWARCSASGCAPSARRAPSTVPCTRRCPPSGSTPSPRGGADDDRLGAVRRRRRRPRCGCRGRRHRGRRGDGAPQRLARDAVARAARRGRDRARPGRVRQRHRGRGRAAPRRCARRHRPLHRRRRRARVARPAAPRVVRPGRGHRADRPRRLPRARRPGRAPARPVALARGGRRRGDGIRACAAVAARASRPASSGRRCARPPPT